jgi:aspartate aminotransferase-like enzyme
MKRARLFTPGPTAVPAEVLEAQARPMVHHRTDEFKQAMRDVLDGLKYIMKTENPVVVLASSGSGGMEATVVNLTAPGEKVIVTEIGKFSERWRLIAEAFGVEVVSVEAEWGDPVTADQVAAAFDANPGATVLFTTHSETSTGVLQDVKAFARIAHDHDALIAVDGITSIGCHDVRADDWGLDALVGGSQKGVMIPPGIGYVSLSNAAIDKMKKRRHPVYYFDLIAGVEKAESGDTPFTPAITLVFALQQALEMMRDEGVGNIIARHASNAAAVRAAVTALELELLSHSPSNALTAVVAPEGKTGDIIKRMEHTYGVKVAGGQAQLKGKIFRLGHLGYYYPVDMYTMISALEATMADLGLSRGFGPGVEALQKSYAEAGK